MTKTICDCCGAETVKCMYGGSAYTLSLNNYLALESEDLDLCEVCYKSIQRGDAFISKKNVVSECCTITQNPEPGLTKKFNWKNI